MDLTKQFPRSPYDMNAGLVMVCRTADKCRAHLAGTLGDYHYDCPLDQLLFGFFGTNAEDFSAGVEECGTDAELAEWIEREFPRSAGEKNAFNNMMRHGTPQDEEALEKFKGWQKDLDRSDYFSYFDHLDADEGRF